MPRPNVVLDTNVVVSAHLNEEGLEKFVVNLALLHKIQLFLSAEILEEYRNVLCRPVFRLSPEKVAASLQLIETAAIKVAPERNYQQLRTLMMISS
jgi:putative PIN family toxin of toxin-antitoxin system